MTQYAFYFDGARCSGCKTCEMSCKDYNDLDLGVSYRKVYETTLGEITRDAQGCISTTCVSYSISMACNHCDDPACVHVRPTGAMRKDAETGLVSVDASKCIGCGYCHMTCPCNAPRVDRVLGHSVKCDGCANRLAEGLKPVCVESCPARVLDFGPVEDMAKKGELAAIAPLHEPSYTHPSLYILPCEDAKPAGDAAAKVVNPLEMM